MIAKRHEHNNKIYYQTLKGHTEDGLKILKAYFDTKGHILKNFCKRWDLNDETFCKNLFLAVATHDIGKLTKEFQNNISQGKRSSKYPHAFFGIPIAAQIPFDEISNLPLYLFAILGHHTQLYRTIYSSDRIAFDATYLESEVLNFINSEVRSFYDRLNFNAYFDLPDFKIDSFQNLDKTKIFDLYILPHAKKASLGGVRIKSIFSYLFSILQLCDDYSSAHFTMFIEQNKPNDTEFDSVIKDTTDYVYDLNFSKNKIKNILFKNYNLFRFQEELSDNLSKYSFLFAPCGRGKTEAALYWAFNLKRELNRDKIVFALPTQVTCNAMYSRLIDKFGEKNVGLFHGKSLIALKYQKCNFVFDEDEQDNEGNDIKAHDILRDEVFKGNVFFKPITITTIDHLAYAFVHGFSQADFACGNLQNAVIIFDEVHYYEKHTLNVLNRLFHILRQMEIPHLLMTGTAPDFLLKELKNDYRIITDTEGLSFTPFVINKNENALLDNDSVFRSIFEDYQSEKNIFVILNQVEWTQRFYNNLLEYFEQKNTNPNIILYHSRFIHKDRVKKEKNILKAVKNKPCILVATQVIEISLDISSDVMYTTIAPPDAIGQRAGRLNRSGKYHRNGFTYELKLFQAENTKPYDENIVLKSWSTFSNGATTYSNIKDVCDEVYKNFRLRKDRTYKEYFIKNILFGNHHSDISFGDDEGRSLKIREDNFQQIDVIPSRVFNEAKNRISAKKDFWAEYKVRIPLYKVFQDIKEHGSPFIFRKDEFYNIIECDYEYDYHKGIQFDKTYKRTEIC